MKRFDEVYRRAAESYSAPRPMPEALRAAAEKGRTPRFAWTRYAVAAAACVLVALGAALGFGKVFAGKSAMTEATVMTAATDAVAEEADMAVFAAPESAAFAAEEEAELDGAAPSVGMAMPGALSAENAADGNGAEAGVYGDTTVVWGETAETFAFGDQTAELKSASVTVAGSGEAEDAVYLLVYDESDASAPTPGGLFGQSGAYAGMLRDREIIYIVTSFAAEEDAVPTLYTKDGSAPVAEEDILYADGLGAGVWTLVTAVDLASGGERVMARAVLSGLQALSVEEAVALLR